MCVPLRVPKEVSKICSDCINSKIDNIHQLTYFNVANATNLITQSDSNALTRTRAIERITDEMSACLSTLTLSTSNASKAAKGHDIGKAKCQL